MLGVSNPPKKPGGNQFWVNYRRANDPTTFKPGTGAVWTGIYYSLSVEALWPLSGAAGLGVASSASSIFISTINSLGKLLIGTSI
jgi:hypothetical protein